MRTGKKFPAGKPSGLILFSLLLLARGLAFASGLSANEERALAYIRKLCFDITRYSITGLSSMERSAGFARISRTASSVLSMRKFAGPSWRPVYLFEYYFPEKSGVIAPAPKDGGPVWTSLSFPDETDMAGIAGEEAFFDGGRVLEMLEGGDGRGLDAQEGPARSYSEKDGSLRRFSYGGEEFTVRREGGGIVLVNSYGNALVRKTFDYLYRLEKNETFRLGERARDMSAESRTIYEYSGGSRFPESSVEEHLLEKKRCENRFDGNGRLVMRMESHYEPSPSGADGEEILIDDKKTLNRYDSEGRLCEEEILSWSYRTGASGKRTVEESSARTVYDYSEGKGPGPDEFFYENGTLHSVRKYSGAGSYSEKFYFDEGFSVELFYENGLKVTEVVYVDDVERRRRDFEY